MIRVIKWYQDKNQDKMEKRMIQRIHPPEKLNVLWKLNDNSILWRNGEEVNDNSMFYGN